MIKKIYQQIFSEKFRWNLHVFSRKVSSLMLRGEGMFCPCCETSFKKFLSKGNGLDSRNNAVCPGCGSLERTRLLYLFLKNETDIFENEKRILHFAPEDSLKDKFKNNPNYFDADLNPMLATHQMDITNITQPDQSFDFIICSHVLGHIPDEKRAISELYRVLKSGGNLFLLSLMNPDAENSLEIEGNLTEEQRLKNYGEKDLQRLYGTDLRHKLADSQVNIEIIDYRTNFSDSERKKMSLGDGKREIIYQITKT